MNRESERTFSTSKDLSEFTSRDVENHINSIQNIIV